MGMGWGMVGLAIFNGVWLVRWLAPGLSRAEWVAGGAVVGLAGLAWTGFLFSWMVGLNAWSIAWTAAAQGLLLLGWIAGQWRQGGRGQGWARLRLAGSWPARSCLDALWWGGWTLFFGWLFGRVWQIGASGAIETAPATNYGDLAFHVSIITSLAYGENLPPENPIYLGLPLTYPFLIDFLTALLLRCGMGWREAFLIGNVPLGLALIGLVEQLTRRWSGGNRLAGRLAPLLLVFSGGLGWLRFGGDLVEWWRGGGVGREGLFWFLTHLPGTYTIGNELSIGGEPVALQYGNLLTTLLVPQRSFLFGLPLVALILLLWRAALVESPAGGRESWRLMGLAGGLTGLLPLLHAHGFFAVMLATLPMMALYRGRAWLAFLVPAGLLAAPQALWLGQSRVRQTLFQFQPGWEAGSTHPALFWMVNNGLFLLVLLATLALFLRQEGRRSHASRFYWPFASWFLVPNLVLLAPWAWDNIKVLAYWALASSCVVAMGVAWLLRGESPLGARWGRPIGAGVLVLLVFAGGLDVARGLSPAERVPLFSASDQVVAQRIRETTPPRARILHAPIHNGPVALTGRRSLMGYAGHLWSHGIDYQPREAEVRQMLAGTEAGIALLARYQVEYVLIGPAEMALSPPACLSCFSSRYPVVFEAAGSRLFHLRGRS
jgi:hypothetical protein